MPSFGVVPDEVSFNTLLVLYGHARDMDGAYRCSHTQTIVCLS